jgi:protein involved in polysaccharide export with SLBB domain
MAVLTVASCNGCYTPVCAPAVDASCLPDSYRTPYRSIAEPLNLASLTAPPPQDYILGPDDILEVTVPDLFRTTQPEPFLVRVMGNGQISLPLLPRPVLVGGLNLLQAQQEIVRAYSDGILVNPFVNVHLSEKAAFQILVLGEVTNPDVYDLPRYQNDVGHALAAAGGITRDAADFIEVHRRIPVGSQLASSGIRQPISLDPRPVQGGYGPEIKPETIDHTPGDPKKIIRIPLRGLPPTPPPREDVVLEPGDVVVVPSRRFEVFWVVGQLDESARARFSLSDRQLELGAGLILPRDRDIDVVTAVAMAGYIDPIDSPTTVTVHRTTPDGQPMLIKVDLIKARYDRKETVMVQPGDIIYVNPDCCWWFRRTLDRVVPEIFMSPYRNFMIRHILGTNP